MDDASGLTAPRLSVLSILVFAGPRTLGELAAIEQVRPPTMTRLVAALEEDGYVTRSVDKSDGRIWNIKATARGERIMWTGRARRVAALSRKLSSLSTSERNDLQRAVGILSRVASA